MPSTNWFTNYFSSRKDNDLGNQNTTIYSSAWVQLSDHATKLTLLTKDSNTVIFAADAEGTLIPLHSFYNLGGTFLLRLTDKIVCCLIGSGHLGVAVIVEEKSATEDCTFFSPPAGIIIAGKSPAELQTIPSSLTNGGIEYAGCSTFLPAPWLTNVVLLANSNNPFHLILTTSSTAKDFEDAHNADPLYLTLAKSHLEDFARWAWGT